MFFVPPVVFAAASGAAAYVGPGDVVGSAVAFWGLRAYTLASIGANAVRLREDGGNTQQDFATIAGGGLDLAAIATFKGANNLFVAKIYDQVGTNHAVQANGGDQPSFILSGIGALPIMSFTNKTLVSGNVTQSQPFTISYVAHRTGATTAFSDVCGNNTPNVFAGFNNSTNTAYQYAGSLVTATAADASVHAFQMVFNGASSDLNVDGSVNTVNANTGGFSAAVFMIGDSGFSHGFTGDVMEIGLWGSAFSGTNSSNMSSNQHTYWGF